MQAHWPALVAADFFPTEVWTTRGLVTYYTAFVIELQSRRVQILGSTPYPDEAFVIQCLRSVTNESDALLQRGKIWVCDRDRKWSRAVEQWLSTAGVRVVRTPPRAPNCNAHAERFVRSVKEERLQRVVPLGESHLVECDHWWDRTGTERVGVVREGELAVNAQAAQRRTLTCNTPRRTRSAFSPCDIRERSGSCPDLRMFRIIAVRGDGPVLPIGSPQCWFECPTGQTDLCQRPWGRSGLPVSPRRHPDP